MFITSLSILNFYCPQAAYKNDTKENVISQSVNSHDMMSLETVTSVLLLDKKINIGLFRALFVNSFLQKRTNLEHF